MGSCAVQIFGLDDVDVAERGVRSRGTQKQAICWSAQRESTLRDVV
jgi:hypothetical protein